MPGFCSCTLKKFHILVSHLIYFGNFNQCLTKLITMRLKLLLVMLLVSSGMLIAQDTIKTLIISEAKMDRAEQAYCEITNMGTEAVNLKDFEFGMITPWNGFPEGVSWPDQAPQVDHQNIERLPDVVLQPGESYVIGTVNDYTEEMYARDIARFGFSYDWGQEFLTKDEMWDLIDLQVHAYESPGGPLDSMSRNDTVRELNYYQVMEVWGGRDVFFLRHHISPTDSAVIDQVGGLFSDGDGTNPDAGNVDVAGVEGATGSHILVRRFDVKQGNTTFVTGTDLTDSEWIPIPMLNGGYNERLRAAMWTIGNHVNASLDETTLVSSTVDVDWASKTMTVPWGIRNNDSIMYQFDYVPGLAWHYDYAPSHEDSAYSSVRTGDVLTLYACGNTLQTEVFTLEVAPPTTDANIVVPKYQMIYEGNNRGTYVGAGIPYEVTDGVPGMDTIRDIGFATRVDSLLKYLEKAPNATWEIVWVDGNERTDLMNGDLLRVTAEDGTSVKDYFLKLDNYFESRNADLSSITWPDIPEWLKGIYGWMGDTIPNWSSAVQNYTVTFPVALEIPALVAKTADPNATLQITRAKSLFGSVADRTVTFSCIAENDTTIKEYTVTLEKEKDPSEIQPWLGEPFFSQFVWQDQWANSFMEIVNPATAEVDLSRYMVYFGYIDDPAEAIRSASTADDFDSRYSKYIPGYIWVDTTTWAATPGICVQDLNVNPIVYPGDVFVMADIWSTGQAYSGGGWGQGNWPAENNTDINFGNAGIKPCPWESPPNAWTALRQWTGGHYYLWKIIGEGGDSVLNGTKPATDPNDFLLLDVIGVEGTEAPVICGETLHQTSGFTRKPEIYHGNPELGGSLGDSPETSEWIMVDRPYFNRIGVGWPMDILRITDGIGSHYMDPVTVGISTIASTQHKVSQGYSLDETILGEKEGTTVDQFLAKLSKLHPDQTLVVKSGGAEITGDAVLTNGDSLVVVSADGTNMSRYWIEVTPEGTLSNDALLTSSIYDIMLEPVPLVTGFDIGTPLRVVISGVNVPAGATMNVIDANNAYVPTKTVNFDTLYVDVLASSNVFFEVIAEDGVTKITYQLIPNGTTSDAYVTSSVFDVDQDRLLISLIPEGTNVGALLSNLVPSTGASMKLLDKLGYERSVGMVVMDDRLVVTSYDQTNSTTYYLAMLEELATYLAYVVSDVYVVDQEGLSIFGATGSTSVSDFLANLTPAEGATMLVQDASGLNKAGGDMMAEDDVLQVTAANGINIVFYEVDLDYTGIDEQDAATIRIYPNPSSGQLYIAGVEPGTRIRVYNSVGVAVHDFVAYSALEQVSLEDQPNGVYFVTVSNGDTVNRYKVIRH